MRWKFERYLENWPLALFLDGVAIVAGGILFSLILPGGRDQLFPAICFGGLACLIAIVGLLVRWRSSRRNSN